jgi:hypothetical protein
MKNIFIIPTNKPSRLAKVIDHRIEEFRFNSDFYKKVNFTETKQEYLPQHIYITSDEKIKDGDWVLSFLDDESYEQPFKIEKTHFNCGFDFKEDFKKIILTTDQDLIKDGVQAIDDEFLEWFVKNSSCERVDVTTFFSGINYPYEIIIPKEEPNWSELENSGLDKPLVLNKEFKQETLEEFAKREAKIDTKELIQNNTEEAHTKPPTYEDVCDAEEYGIKLGAKWQQEQDKKMYSEEEVKDLILKFNNDKPGIYDASEWFEQFKKKQDQ